MIDISCVSWTYPHADAPALRELYLRIRPGEFVVLCGASGSGKSTVLRLINGLIPQFHEDGDLVGSVTVDGLVTTQVELDAIGLVSGSVLQHPRRQFFTDTVREEIAFGMENFGFPRSEILDRVDAAINALSDWTRVDQRLRDLSGGQQQQVAIAAATAHRPKMLLLDEPSSNLSADAVARLVDTLAQAKAAGVTVVIAEHRLRYLEALVDRVIVVRDGRIDVEWSSEAFRSVSDAELAREGLRGVVRSADLPSIVATGTSVAQAGPPVHSAQQPGLELRSIRCRHGGRTVLDVEYAVFPSSAVTAIRGANGAGKSTLARVLAGLQRSSGSVLLDGRPLSPRARRLSAALVMQDVQRQLFTESVAAEIALARSGSDTMTDVGRLLDDLDLAPFAERHPLSLSGGQQQRLLVATVRVAGRRIVVFDEPSSGVDRRHLTSIADQIRRVAADGAVVLLISHDDDLVAAAADRQLVLRSVSATATTSSPSPRATS